MIADFAPILENYTTAYTKITSSVFEYNGITYDNSPTTSTINGVITPLTTEDSDVLSNLGYSLIGKILFFVPGTESLLTEHDTIVDSTGLEWIILPTDTNKSTCGIEDWREHGNFVKYTLSRKVLS